MRIIFIIIPVPSLFIMSIDYEVIRYNKRIFERWCVNDSERKVYFNLEYETNRKRTLERLLKAEMGVKTRLNDREISEGFCYYPFEHRLLAQEAAVDSAIMNEERKEGIFQDLKEALLEVRKVFPLQYFLFYCLIEQARRLECSGNDNQRKSLWRR